MTSFRVRLALLVGLSTAAMLLAAAFLAWNFTSDLNVERLERDLQHVARANLGRVADASHWGRLDAAFGVVSGRDNAPGYVIWVKNFDRVVYRSPGWPADLRAGKTVELTAREFALLTYLMRSPGQTFTRAQICEHVWNYHFDPGTNLVDVYVQRLRRKLQDGEVNPLIETVRGVGYRVAG